MAQQKQFLGYKEIQQEFGPSRSTIQRMVSAGEWERPSKRTHGSKAVWPRSYVERRAAEIWGGKDKDAVKTADTEIAGPESLDEQATLDELAQAIAGYLGQIRLKLDDGQLSEITSRVTDGVLHALGIRQPTVIWMNGKPKDPNQAPFARIRISGKSSNEEIHLNYATATDMLANDRMRKVLMGHEKVGPLILKAVAIEESKRQGKPVPSKEQTDRMLQEVLAK